MKKQILVLLISFSLFFSFNSLFAEETDAGSRASFTRSGFVGARYVASGMTGEVLSDDVFSIYWNPAGLSEIKGKSSLSIEDIQERARNGDISGISEDDISFTESEEPRTTFEIGISAAKLDVDRNVGFVGIAFDLFGGVFGVGAYTINSFGIEGRDDNGVQIGDQSYAGSAGFLSYSRSFGVTSVGVSFKGLHEKIGDKSYYGSAIDGGIQIFVLPFLKLGFVMQDVAIGLMPFKNSSEVENNYDLGWPTMRFGAAVSLDNGLTISGSVIKKLEQEKIDGGFGIAYKLTESAIVYLGLNGSSFSSGFSFKFGIVDISYAFSVDNIDHGKNNILSLGLVF